MKPDYLNNKSYYFLNGILIALILVVFSCDKDDDTSSTSPADINGFWIVNESVTDNCSGTTETEQSTKIYSVKQNGSQLLVTYYPNCDVINGTRNGDVITWEGTLPSGSGNIDIDFSGTLSANGTQTSGTANWEWYSGNYQCTGTSTISGHHVVHETVDFSGEWHGTWESEDNSYSGTFIANVTQNDTILSGTISVPEISLSGAVLKGLVSGNVVYFGDVNETIQFVGTLENTTASGNYSYMSNIDEGGWTGAKQ